MFSVIIPSYNHERYLPEAVVSSMQESLVAEILIGDDGSRDGSLQAIERLSQAYPNLIKNLTQYPPTNIGAHAMLNKLIDSAGSPWIAVLNSDDMFVPGRFAAIKTSLRMSRFEFCFGNITIIDDTSTVLGRKRAFLDPQYDFPIPPNSSNMFSSLLCQNYIATTSNMVFTKSLWERVGGFGDYRYAHDWDFAIRSMLLAKAEYIPEALTYYRVHSSNTIKESRRKQDEEVKSIFRKLVEDFGDSTFEPFSVSLSSNEYLR